MEALNHTFSSENSLLRYQSSVFILTTASLILFPTYFIFKRYFHELNSNDILSNEKNQVNIELLDVESSTLMGMTPSISAINIFEGNPTVVDQCLQLRLKDILTNNPWLAGKLIKKSNKTHLIYSLNSTFSLTSHYKVIEDSIVDESLAYPLLVS